SRHQTDQHLVDHLVFALDRAAHVVAQTIKNLLGGGHLGAGKKVAHDKSQTMRPNPPPSMNTLRQSPEHPRPDATRTTPPPAWTLRNAGPAVSCPHHAIPRFDRRHPRLGAHPLRRRLATPGRPR